MRSRGQDVDAFMSSVKELDQRSEQEDKQRLERMKKQSENEEDRFARLKAREAQLRLERQNEMRTIAVTEQKQVEQVQEKGNSANATVVSPLVTTDVQTPALPKRPEPKGFVASALRRGGSTTVSPGKGGSPLRGLPVPSAPLTESAPAPTTPAKPTWISSAMTRTKPMLPERSEAVSKPSPKPKPKLSPASASPYMVSPAPLTPQHVGVNPKFDRSKSPPSARSVRTPSESLKDARSGLGSAQRSPSPKRLPREPLAEDPLKEFRQQLVLEPRKTPEKTPSHKFNEKPEHIKPSPLGQKPVLKPSTPAAPKPRREPSVPEALRNRSLKPALPVRREAPPSPEAVEKMKMLRPAQPKLTRTEPTPEALERMKSLSKPPKLEKTPEPIADAVRQMENLRPASPVERQAPPSPEALDRLHSLRKAKPKTQDPTPVPEAHEQLKSLKPTKPNLSRSPKTNLRQTSSNSDFRASLSAAIARGPRLEGDSPLRRTRTDFEEPQAPLEHLTKSRPRGPKRKLPSSTRTREHSINVAKRDSLKEDAKGFSREELKRIASAKRKPSARKIANGE